MDTDVAPSRRESSVADPYRMLGIATATWRKRLATRGTSRGPRRCHDGDRSAPLLIAGFDHRRVADTCPDLLVVHLADVALSGPGVSSGEFVPVAVDEAVADIPPGPVMTTTWRDIADQLTPRRSPSKPQGARDVPA